MTFKEKSVIYMNDIIITLIDILKDNEHYYCFNEVHI